MKCLTFIYLSAFTLSDLNKYFRFDMDTKSVGAVCTPPQYQSAPESPIPIASLSYLGIGEDFSSNSTLIL